MAVGKPLHLRLFMEGVEVPVVSAQVSINVNGPSSASIQVVPLDEVFELKPRTMVHLFFLDTKYEDGKDGDTDTVLKAELGTYRLLFAGETIGFALAKQPSARSVVLQCLDFSSYWDSAHATAVEYGPHGNAFTNVGSLWGGAVGLFDDIVNQQAEVISRWIREKPQTPGLQTVSGLAGGIIRMMEAMGGVPGQSRGINDFFTVAELRCRLLSQITAEENDNTASNILSESVFQEWLRSGLQNAGQQVTFRDMMKLLFRYIHYESVPNPTSKFDKAYNNGSVTTKAQTYPLKNHPVVREALKPLEELEVGLPPGARYAVGSDALINLSKSTSQVLSDIITKLRKLTAQKGNSPTLVQAVDSLNNAKGISDSVFYGETGNQIQAAVKFISQAIKVLKTGTEKVTGGSSTSTDKKVARLRSQVIRPDCWFAPPPRCNVIFPEHFTQLTYDRIHIQEVTRVLFRIYNQLIGPDALLADRVLAPVMSDIKVLDDAAKEIQKKQEKATYRTLMPHELHTGIIPRTEWMPNTMASVSSKDPREKNVAKGARISWAKKMALFHFFKYRFGPRQAQVGGRFNPFLVCGFPTVVIQAPYIPKMGGEGVYDQGAMEDAIQNAEKYGAPQQIIGMIGGISHNIDQNGGSTTVSIHHARLHLGADDDFLNIYTQTKEPSQKKRIKYCLRLKDVQDNEKLLKFLADLTPQSAPPSLTTTTTVEKEKVSSAKVKKASFSKAGKTTEATDREIKQTSYSTVTKEIRGYAVLGKIGDSVCLVPSESGKLSPGDKGLYGGAIAGIELQDSGSSELHEPSNRWAFSSVVVHEDIVVPMTKHMPIEDVLRPTWFSKKYQNSRVGEEIYQPFFGCGSIIDEATFLGASEKPLTMRPSDDPVTTVSLTESPESVITKLVAAEDSRSSISVERATTLISYLYGLTKTKGLDVDNFIRSFTDRPIATMREIIGDLDIEKYMSVSPDGKVTVSKRDDGSTPQVGFHTMAFAQPVVDKGKLAGLIEDPDLQLQRINQKGKEGPVEDRYDIRKEKKGRVLAYRIALENGPGFKG